MLIRGKKQELAVKGVGRRNRDRETVEIWDKGIKYEGSLLKFTHGFPPSKQLYMEKPRDMLRIFK